MKTVLFFLFTIFCLMCRAQVVNTDSVSGKLVAYCEVYGHNYYGAEETNETGHFSINAAFRRQLGKNQCYLMASAGWGSFRLRHYTHVQNQPTVYYYDWVHFFPCELTFQVSGVNTKRHYFEAGIGVTFAFGKQQLVFPGRSSSHAPESIVTVSNGIQYVPRLGYVFCSGKGLLLRISLTPHLGTGYDARRPFWLPLGGSVGWVF